LEVFHGGKGFGTIDSVNIDRSAPYRHEAFLNCGDGLLLVTASHDNGSGKLQHRHSASPLDEA
jgi:hypothetical protein